MSLSAIVINAIKVDKVVNATYESITNYLENYDIIFKEVFSMKMIIAIVQDQIVRNFQTNLLSIILERQNCNNRWIFKSGHNFLIRCRR